MSIDSGVNLNVCIKGHFHFDLWTDDSDISYKFVVSTLNISNGDITMKAVTLFCSAIIKMFYTIYIYPHEMISHKKTIGVISMDWSPLI